ncbi:MAG: hypothetical protein JW702_11705 [Clostridiales bacterium]|nr:hypothetical protein [Clostridiales bacterium]
MNNEYSLQLDWNDFITLARQYVEAYCEATKSFLQSDSESERAKLSILLLSNRARSQRTFEIIERSVYDQMDDSKDIFLEAFRDANEIFDTIISEQSNIIEKIISEDLLPELHDLEEKLLAVRYSAQDCMLVDDATERTKKLRKQTQQFLQTFIEYSYVTHELKSDYLNKKIPCEAFIEKFNSLEQLFEKYFGYFHTEKDFLVSMSDRELGSEKWWFKSTPEYKEEEGFIKLTDRIIKEAFGHEDASDHIKCSMSDLAIRYALDDLNPSEHQRVKDHVSDCSYCMKLVADVQNAEAESSGINMDDIEVPQSIWDMFPEKKIKKNDSKLIDLFDFVWKLPTQRVVSVGIVATLLIVISIFTFYERPSTDGTDSLIVSMQLKGFITEQSTTRDVPSDHKTPTVLHTIYGTFKLGEDDTLSRDSSFKVEFSLSHEAYVYLFLVNAHGNIKSLEYLVDHTKYEAQSSIIIPRGETEAISLDATAGRKTVYLLASVNKIDEYEEKLQTLQRMGLQKIHDIFPKVKIHTSSFIQENDSEKK